MSLCLVSETEECEEDQGANHGDPPGKFYGVYEIRVGAPIDDRELIDSTKAPMGVLPRFPSPEILTVQNEVHYAEWNGADDFDSGQAHEANISAGGEVRVI